MKEIMLSFAVIGLAANETQQCSLSFAPLPEQTIQERTISTNSVTTERYEWWIINGQLVQVVVRQPPNNIPAALPEPPKKYYYQLNNSYNNYRTCGPRGCR